MYNNKKILAVIPARGGSKRIPRKNIVDVNGKPLIAYTIELAKKVPEFDAVVVSSDDSEILDVSKRFGAEPLLRPAELAQDATQDDPVLIHTLEALEHDGRSFDFIVMLQCTLPLRTIETVRKVVHMGIDGEYDVVSTTVEDRNKYRWHRNDEWIEVVPGASRRSQEREPYYREADVCYMINAENLKKSGRIFSGKYTFVPVNEIENIDINNASDLKLVTALMNIQNAHGN